MDEPGLFGRLVLRHPTATPIELKHAPFSELAPTPSVNLANTQSLPNKRFALRLPLTFPYVKDRGAGSYFPYILLNEIQTMFSQLAKRSARVLAADLCTDHAH